jgi:biopolymer transport protein ExbD
MNYEYKPEPGNEIRNDINVVPLIDVILVLLVIFMIAMPAISLSVRTSSADQRISEELTDNDFFSIVLYGNGELEYDGAVISEEELADRLVSESRGRVLIRTENDVTCGRLNRILAIVSAGSERTVEISDL